MKKILTVALLVSAVFFTGCAKEAATETNGATTETEALTRKVPTETKENTPEYFNITHMEFTEALADKYLIDLDFFKTVDGDTGEKITSYTFMTENDTAETMMHYQVTYDETTDNIYTILFMVDKDFMGNLENAYTRFFYHVAAVSSVIAPTVDTDKVYDSLKGIGAADEVKVYTDDVMSLVASNHDDYITAVFVSPTKTNAKE